MDSLEINIMIKYGQDKVLNTDNGKFVHTNAWKSLFRKMKSFSSYYICNKMHITV